jgi:hypothetical protein
VIGLFSSEGNRDSRYPWSSLLLRSEIDSGLQPDYFVHGFLRRRVIFFPDDTQDHLSFPEPIQTGFDAKSLFPDKALDCVW